MKSDFVVYLTLLTFSPSKTSHVADHATFARVGALDLDKDKSLTEGIATNATFLLDNGLLGLPMEAYRYRGRELVANLELDPCTVKPAITPRNYRLRYM